jgi:group II intron reverse transcriptase/maturase/CRISPR-associated endonuclease Cas1
MNDFLFQQLCTKEALYRAWQHVKEKNTAGGIDRKTVEGYAVTLDKNLHDLLNALQSGKYIQQPYKEVFIPKNLTEKRKLGLLTVNDKILQTAVTQLITPKFERDFLGVSYGYRAHRGAVKAINKVRHLISQEHYTWLASCDIDNFFDSIPHDLLFRRLAGYLKSSSLTELIKMFVTMGSVNNLLTWKEAKTGIPLGGVISPLLANFYLNPLDQLMVERKYGFVRYSDDFVILGKIEHEAKWALNEAVDLITNHLRLNLNEGTEIIPVSDGFEFLGIFFKDQKITLSERKYKRLVSKMSTAARVGNGFITPKLKEVMLGISSFYGKLIPQDILSKLDDELLSILRLKAEELKPGKSKWNETVNEVRQIEFFSHKHNFQRAEYVKNLFSEPVKKGRAPAKLSPSYKSPLKSEKAVAKRKNEYQKMQSEGFDLVLSTPGTVISKRENKLVVRKSGIVVQEVHLINLKNITILCEGIGFSSNVIQACAEYRISVDFLKRDGLPYAMLHSPVFFEAKTGIGQLEAYTNGKCFYLVRRFVWGKIINQANLLKYYSKYYLKRNQAFSENFETAIKTLKAYAFSVLHTGHDDLDSFRQSMFGMEGQASACYWEAISHIVNTRIPFPGRERQGATDLANCMLNYGYGILYSRVSEAIIMARLNPNLSFLHKPENNRPSLVYDLIEEFRQQAVDRAVFAVITKSKDLKVTDGQLEERTKKLVATKVIKRLNTVEKFRNREFRLFEIIQHQALSLAKYLEGEERNYKPYIRKW